MSLLPHPPLPSRSKATAWAASGWSGRASFGRTRLLWPLPTSAIRRSQSRPTSSAPPAPASPLASALAPPRRHPAAARLHPPAARPLPPAALRRQSASIPRRPPSAPRHPPQARRLQPQARRLLWAAPRHLATPSRRQTPSLACLAASRWDSCASSGECEDRWQSYRSYHGGSAQRFTADVLQLPDRMSQARLPAPSVLPALQPPGQLLRWRLGAPRAVCPGLLRR